MRYVSAFLLALCSFIIVTFASVGAASAADLPPEDSILDLIQPVIKAATAGSPALACALALVLAVALARRYGSKRWPWLAGDIGGTLLTFLGSLGAAFAAALTGGALPSMSLLWTALTIAAGASGGYSAIRRVVAPALRFLESKLPAWAKPLLAPIFNMVLWAFESKKATTIAKAEAAGKAAVEAKPAPGIEGITGAPKDFP